MIEKIHAKKSLGQHFLRSKEALRKIIVAADLKNGETVLEIGPGEGVLTEALLEGGVKVIAVEADVRCVKKLEERFAEEINGGELFLIHGDIRDETAQNKLFSKKRAAPLRSGLSRPRPDLSPLLEDKPYKLVANIPYYLTGILFRLFLEKLPARARTHAGGRQPSLLVFLVQKEVAEQIVGRNGKESILSLAIKVYGVPRYVATIKREAFSPPPNVDSAIITVTDISRKKLGKLTDEDYFRVVKAGLGSKRKMLSGNLSRSLKIPKEKLGVIFKKLSIDERTRGEDVPVEKWVALAQEIKKAVSLN
ncbi:MAG TPA: rRNA adenine dimethyltransferase family protein [Candidatus Paceibacterota bacterium]